MKLSRTTFWDYNYAGRGKMAEWRRSLAGCAGLRVKLKAKNGDMVCCGGGNLVTVPFPIYPWMTPFKPSNQSVSNAYSKVTFRCGGHLNLNGFLNNQQKKSNMYELKQKNISFQRKGLINDLANSSWSFQASYRVSFYRPLVKIREWRRLQVDS